MAPLRHHTEQDELVLTLDGGIVMDDIPALLDRTARLLDDYPRGSVVLDLALVLPGLAAVEAVLRMQLHARRGGRTLLIRHTPMPLEQVLASTGLGEALRSRERCGCRVCGDR